jgi:uncharacterized repeat protein (TIGR03803 family)
LRSTGSKPFKEGKFTSKSIMKTSIKNTFLLPALVAALGIMMARQATAQTFTTVYTFSIRTGGYLTNSDGAYPESGLILSGNTLYGTTHYGGGSGLGTVYSVNTGGTVFSNLYSFPGGSGGLEPTTGLVLSGNMLYGSASPLFGLETNGTGFTNLFSFPGTDAANLNGLILSGGTLYGTSYQGGTNGVGTIFSINLSGNNYTNLFSFPTDSGYPAYTNAYGEYPLGGLVLSGNTLYGTTSDGGIGGSGTVFAINTNGSSFTNLYYFSARSGASLTNTDGAFPYAGLVLAGNTLYGTTKEGGTNNTGTVFAINTGGGGFTDLYSMSALVSSTNADGAYPQAPLTLSGSTLYGMARNGGSAGNGTLFALGTTGAGFTNLHNFTADPYEVSNGAFTNSDGILPNGGLILSGNVFYGTAEAGGLNGVGTVFSLSLVSSAPTLNLNLSGTNVILTWAAAGYTLQSTTNLAPPAVWDPVSGQNAVTNPISGTRKFYRLSQ